LQPLVRVPMPGQVGKLSRADLIELLDGYLISYTYTWGVWSGELQHPFQQVVRVDGKGHVQDVARRAITLDLPVAYTSRNTWLSPVIRALCLGAQDLFAAKDPLRAKPEPAPMQPASSRDADSAATDWQVHSSRGRWAWVLLCGVVGLPALASLWLLYPRRESLPAPELHAQPVAA